MAQRDPPERPNPAVVVTMAVMLIAVSAFSAGLHQDVTPLRVAIFIVLVGAALYWFQRNLRKSR